MGRLRRQVLATVAAVVLLALLGWYALSALLALAFYLVVGPAGVAAVLYLYGRAYR